MFCWSWKLTGWVSETFRPALRLFWGVAVAVRLESLHPERQWIAMTMMNWCHWSLSHFVFHLGAFLFQRSHNGATQWLAHERWHPHSLEEDEIEEEQEMELRFMQSRRKRKIIKRCQAFTPAFDTLASCERRHDSISSAILLDWRSLWHRWFFRLSHELQQASSWNSTHNESSPSIHRLVFHPFSFFLPSRRPSFSPCQYAHLRWWNWKRPNCPKVVIFNTAELALKKSCYFYFQTPNLMWLQH